jgi:hypothetical protein
MSGQIVYIVVNSTLLCKSIDYGRTFSPSAIQAGSNGGSIKLTITGVIFMGHYGLGILSDKQNNKYTGYIDEFNIFDKKITASEVDALYNNYNNNAPFNYQTSVTANIYPKPIVASLFGTTKLYDMTTRATITYTLSGSIIDGDSFDISSTLLTSNFYNATVETNKLIYVTNIFLTNPNYFTSISGFAYADILKGLANVLFLKSDKFYDGTQLATINYSLFH